WASTGAAASETARAAGTSAARNRPATGAAKSNDMMRTLLLCKAGSPIPRPGVLDPLVPDFGVGLSDFAGVDKPWWRSYISCQRFPALGGAPSGRRLLAK